MRIPTFFSLFLRSKTVAIRFVTFKRRSYWYIANTLVGFLLPAWTESKKRKAIKTGKFYFFDPGITHMLAGTETLDHNSNLYGKSFEQFIYMELRAYLSYRRKKLSLTYWRSKSGHEVDLLIGKRTAIEVKASKKISRNDLT